MITEYVTVQTVDKSELSLLEQAFPGELPSDFLHWIASYGGSSVRPELAMPNQDGNAILDWFFTPREIVDNYQAKGSFAETIPHDFAMIGYGPGCGVCLRLRGASHGSVWFADLDLANDLLPEAASSDEIMLKLSDHWQEFITSR